MLLRFNLQKKSVKVGGGKKSDRAFMLGSPTSGYCPALSEIATNYFILELVGLGNSLRRTLSRDHPCDFKNHLIPG